MKDFFRGQDVSEIVHHGYAEPADMTAYNNLTEAEKDVLREQRKKDGKALFCIHQAVHESILPRVAAKLILSKHGIHWKPSIKVWIR